MEEDQGENDKLLEDTTWKGGKSEGKSDSLLYDIRKKK